MLHDILHSVSVFADIEDSLGTMDILTIVFFALSAVVIPIVGFFMKRSFDKYFAKKEEELRVQKEKDEKLKMHDIEAERAERKKDMKDAIDESIEPIKKDLEVLKKGTQAGLRHDLVMLADEWIPKGYCPRTIKDEFDNMYNQYHILGKNGVMDSTYQTMLALPEMAPAHEKSATRCKTAKKPLTQTANN